ncbi:MAG: PHB depolymerase family esterase [Pseudomonadota bacterium]
MPTVCHLKRWFPLMQGISAFVLSCAALSAPAHACSTTTPCEVEGGAYFIALPEGAGNGAPLPAVMFIHGFGGRGEGVFRNTGMTSKILERGYALIAPSGLKMEGRSGGSWSFHPERFQRRDEIAFLTRTKEAATQAHNIDPDRILLSGFSIGGSMTSYLACQAPDRFSAYAPVGGSFWRPHPKGCEGDVRLLHTHGWTDGTVPLEGRLLRGTDVNAVGALAQGDVFRAMDIWRETNDCIHLKADKFVTEGFFWRRKWERCLPGSALEFALFPGGHVIPQGWADMALDWFEALPPKS